MKSRYTLLIDHVRREEDEARASLAQVREAIARIEERIAGIDREEQAAARHPALMREQYLFFCRCLGIRRFAAWQELADQRKQEAARVEALLAVHQRLRSLEQLARREREEARKADERRDARDADDLAVRRWQEAITP